MESVTELAGVLKSLLISRKCQWDLYPLAWHRETDSAPLLSECLTTPGIHREGTVWAHLPPFSYLFSGSCWCSWSQGKPGKWWLSCHCQQRHSNQASGTAFNSTNRFLFHKWKYSAAETKTLFGPIFSLYWHKCLSVLIETHENAVIQTPGPCCVFCGHRDLCWSSSHQIPPQLNLEMQLFLNFMCLLKDISA